MNLVCNHGRKKGHIKVDFLNLQNKNKNRNKKGEKPTKVNVLEDEEDCDVPAMTENGA